MSFSRLQLTLHNLKSEILKSEISSLRLDYSSRQLLESDVHSHPIDQFLQWWDEAVHSEIVEPNAMTLATASADGLPSARVVLLKGVDHSGFVFYTNYESFKAKQLEENPKCCLVFHWKELERQVRIIGLVKKTEHKESEDYFTSRPIGSQIGAIASPQSRIIPSREWIDQEYEKLKSKFANSKPSMPGHWGGYRVVPVIMEFWQGRPSRLHDRLQYTLGEDSGWRIERLAP
jgi:pyridoxamine 5'-phosphate oxidase